MNITVTTVKAYQILLTDSELDAAIADASTLVPHLKAARNGHGESAATPPMPRTARQVARAAGWRSSRRAPKAKKGKAARKGGAGPGALARQLCPVDGCGKKVAAFRMKYHLSKKHPGVAVPDAKS